jgi:predicted NBD/HSP70 family sugar kinase
MGDDGGLLSLREMNRLRLIEALYHDPASTRGSLARRTGLSRATVSGLIDELTRAGLVEERAEVEDELPRQSGRPPVRLSLVPDSAFAVGLDFGHQHIRVAVCDLTGNPLVDDFSEAEVDHAPVESLDLAHELVRGALRRAGVPQERLLGVGMALAAPIDSHTGEVYAQGILPGWDGLLPAAEMEARLGLPVQVQNDANLGGLGEKLLGAARGVDDLIYIRLSAGVGAGLILGGRPYEGVRGIAGEIGHVLEDRDGLICRCGSRGCLETVASPVAIAGLLARSRGEPVSVPRLLELVAAGDRGARRAVADAGHVVGRALASMVNVLNPELIVVGGELATVGDVLLGPLEAGLDRFTTAPARKSVRLVVGTLGQRAEVLGAAALILSQSPQALAQRVGR